MLMARGKVVRKLAPSNLPQEQKKASTIIRLSMLSIESGRLDSNQRPRAPQTCTLTGLSYAPNFAGAKVHLIFDFPKIL